MIENKTPRKTPLRVDAVRAVPGSSKKVKSVAATTAARPSVHHESHWTDNKAVLWLSLVVNGIFVLALLAGFAMLHMRNYHISSMLNTYAQNTCPDPAKNQISSKTNGKTETITYSLSTGYLNSGCADSIVEGARITDYLTHPEHAATDAKAIQANNKGKVTVEVVRDADTGVQVAPMKY